MNYWPFAIPRRATLLEQIIAAAFGAAIAVRHSNMALEAARRQKQAERAALSPKEQV